MADRAISALPTATTLTASDLFVLSQSNQAKNTTWQTIIGYLTTALDGHGGIQSITYTPPVLPSLDGTLTITLADSTHYDVTVTNGNGVNGVVQHWAVSSSDSTTPSTWYTTIQTMTPTNKYLWNYMTLEMDDGNDIDTTPCVAGVYGDTGQAWYVWIRYAGSQPTSDADIGTTPDDWIGVYSGTESDPDNLHYTDFDWFQYKGATGATGAAATITTQNVSYQASNSGTVAPSGSWTTTIPTVPQGSFLWTRTQLQFNDGTTVTSYSVSRYGIDGTGAVSTVNGVSPDGNGNVEITASDIAMSDNQSIETNVTQLQTDVGDVADLTTSASTVVPAINELKTNLNTKFNKTGVARLVGKKIAIYGDSWATATYGSLGKAYIESITGETVHVVGSGSKTMAQIYTNCWDSYDADIYIIEGGLNDASLGTGSTSFTSAIDTWLSAIRTVNADAEIYFVTPPAIKEANQSTTYKFPLEFYRIGIWSCAPFKNYGVINGLKWFDVKLRSDNVHPTSDSVPLIGKHIVNALANYGDEETHTTEVSYLGRNDYYFRIDCINGTVYLVCFNFTGNATSANTCEVTLGTLDTVFSTSSIAFINQKTGGAGDITYRSNNPNKLTLYSYGTASGAQMITLVIKMPVEVSEWVNPYI